MDILDDGQQALLGLSVEDIGDRPLTYEEFMHIAKTLGAMWTYDYQAAGGGKPGMHAELKSGLHSDIFFVSRILLEPPNILDIMAHQVAMKIRNELGTSFVPDHIFGIPDGAKVLGDKVAEILGIPAGLMEKVDGKLVLRTPIQPGEMVLFVEDFFTRGTGYCEAVAELFRVQPLALLAFIDPVILNRGNSETAIVDAHNQNWYYRVLSVVKHQANDWDPLVYCKLCEEYGSVAIKPKATDENWARINKSQR